MSVQLSQFTDIVDPVCTGSSPALSLSGSCFFIIVLDTILIPVLKFMMNLALILLVDRFV